MRMFLLSLVAAVSMATAAQAAPPASPDAALKQLMYGPWNYEKILAGDASSIDRCKAVMEANAEQRRAVQSAIRSEALGVANARVAPDRLATLIEADRLLDQTEALLSDVLCPQASPIPQF